VIDSIVPASTETEQLTNPFDSVPEALRANLVKRGFTELTPIQQAVVNGECAGRNLRLSSQTGSGKTLALGFALYEALTEPSATTVRALVIVPTRELAHQVEAELQWLFEGCAGARTLVVTGGSDIRAEIRRLKSKPTLVVGTPGRLLDHVRNGNLSLADVREVVLDEADQMLDMGFKDELDALVAELPSERRSHLVSATFPDVVKRLAEAFQSNPLQLQGTALGQANADIEHIAHLVFERDKYAALVNILLANLGRRCLVFVQKRIDASDIAESLNEDGFSALPLSGDLPQAQRNRTLAAFKSGTVEILVATDVAARGIHVDDVALVVHEDVPRESEIYTHRSGRTGRAGQKGQSVLLVVPPARRRTEAMLHQARVKFTWAPLPTPQKIKRAQTKKARRTFHDLLTQVDAAVEANTGAVPQANGVDLDFEYAQRLLEHHNPERVVAVLLALSEAGLPTEPRAIVEPPLHAEKPPAWQTHRHPHGAPRSSGPRNRPPFKPPFKHGPPKRGPGFAGAGAGAGANANAQQRPPLNRKGPALPGRRVRDWPSEG
jgi:ATP-dependent RNA helicase DeaD